MTAGEVEVLLTKAEAQALTGKIKAYVGEAWRLLKKAHDEGAHRALGYPSWAAYTAAEFDMSRSYAYRLIAHARMVAELDAAADLTPEVSPMGDTPERVTRGLNAAEVAAAVAAKVAAEPEADEVRRAEIVNETITEQTTKTTERTSTTVDAETGEIVGSQDAATSSPPSASDPAPAAGSDAEPEPEGSSSLTGEDDPAEGSDTSAGSRLRSMPTGTEDGPTAGDLADWHPTAGQWSSYREFHASTAAKSFALLMDRRSPRPEEEDMAGLCPPSMRKPALFAAEQNAAYWAELAAGLKNPTRLSAVEA